MNKNKNITKVVSTIIGGVGGLAASLRMGGACFLGYHAWKNGKCSKCGKKK